MLELKWEKLDGHPHQEFVREGNLISKGKFSGAAGKFSDKSLPAAGHKLPMHKALGESFVGQSCLKVAPPTKLAHYLTASAHLPHPGTVSVFPGTPTKPRSSP